MANAAQKILNRVYPPRNMLFYLQRQVLKPNARRRVSRFIAGWQPENTSTSLQGSDEARILDTDGFVMLPPVLTAQQIADVFAYVADKKCHDRWKPQSGEFLIENAPANCHTAPYRDNTIVECPHLMEAANHPLVLDVVSKLLGCK